jgi:hypothetical protein
MQNRVSLSVLPLSSHRVSRFRRTDTNPAFLTLPLAIYQSSSRKIQSSADVPLGQLAIHSGLSDFTDAETFHERGNAWKSHCHVS